MEALSIIKPLFSPFTGILRFPASLERLGAKPGGAVPVLVCTAHALAIVVFLAAIVDSWLCVPAAPSTATQRSVATTKDC